MKRFVWFLLAALLITACTARISATEAALIPTLESTDTSTPLPPIETATAISTATATATPIPDLGILGFPRVPAGTVAYDFVEQMCAAQWYNRGKTLPCPGDASQANDGYVQQFEGAAESVPADFPMMQVYPPLVHYSTVSSKYPPFTIQKGDRFQTVSACKVRSFCDVEFVLDYFNANGQHGIRHWHYLFTDAPKVIVISLDSLAGQTVQFDLATAVVGNQPDTYAIWVAPHIFRPTR